MPQHKLCPWCGKRLELKAVQVGEKIRAVCNKCGWKIKEIDRPKPKETVEEKKPEIIEVKPEEVPESQPRPIWPVIVGAGLLILIIILFVKFVLLG